MSTVAATSTAQERATEHKIDLDALVASGDITPTGTDDKVLASDVDAYLAARDAPQPASAPSVTVTEDAAAAPAADAPPVKAAPTEALPAGQTRYRLTEKAGGPLPAIIGGSHRVLAPRAVLALPTEDEAVKNLVSSGYLVAA